MIATVRTRTHGCGRCRSRTKRTQLHVEPLATEELLVAVPPGHPFLRKRSVTIEDVGAEPFVLLSVMHCLGEFVVSFCTQQGCQPVLFQPDPQHFLLRHDHTARSGTLRLAHVLAVRPGHLRAVLAPRGREVHGEQGSVRERPRIRRFAGARHDHVCSLHVAGVQPEVVTASDAQRERIIVASAAADQDRRPRLRGEFPIRQSRWLALFPGRWRRGRFQLHRRELCRVLRRRGLREQRLGAQQ